MGRNYTPGKADLARQEKNQWKLRANAAENRLRQIRNLVDSGSSASGIVGAVREALDGWQHEQPNVSSEMASVNRCAAEPD